MKMKTGLLGLLAVSAVALTFSGCMTGPGQYEHIGDKTDPVNFNGFTTTPNEYVYLYARRPGTTNWEYIGWARTGSTPINQFGQDWYYWSKSQVVPNACWNTGWWSATEVRATRTGGTELLTFKQGFFEWFDDYGNLSDLYDDKGNGTVVTVFAN